MRDAVINPCYGLYCYITYNFDGFVKDWLRSNVEHVSCLLRTKQRDILSLFMVYPVKIIMCRKSYRR